MHAKVRIGSYKHLNSNSMLVSLYWVAQKVPHVFFPKMALVALVKSKC